MPAETKKPQVEVKAPISPPKEMISMEVKRKTLAELFVEPCTVLVEHTLMKNAFQLPGATTENSLNGIRPGLSGLKMVYHPGYGLIVYLKGQYSLAPSTSMVVAHEHLRVKK